MGSGMLENLLSEAVAEVINNLHIGMTFFQPVYDIRFPIARAAQIDELYHRCQHAEGWRWLASRTEITCLDLIVSESFDIS
jgi:hypothetical protein